MQQEKARYYLIDGIRGIAIVNMVAFHAMYDICIVYGRDPGWYNRIGPHIWQQFICWTFILVSGFVWSFGRSKNLRRGLIINALGLVISLATLIVTPDQVIWFGILNFLGCAMLLMFPLEKLSSKLPVRWALPLCFLLFLLFRHVDQGYIGVAGLFQLPLPKAMYSLRILAPLGFPDRLFLRRLFPHSAMDISLPMRLPAQPSVHAPRPMAAARSCKTPRPELSGHKIHLGLYAPPTAHHAGLYFVFKMNIRPRRGLLTPARFFSRENS